MAKLLTDHQRNIERHSSEETFGVSITLTDPSAGPPISVIGEYNRHALVIDNQTGLVTVSNESALIIPIDRLDGAQISAGWRVEVVDSTGEVVRGEVMAPAEQDRSLNFLTILFQVDVA